MNELERKLERVKQLVNERKFLYIFSWIALQVVKFFQTGFRDMREAELARQKEERELRKGGIL